MIHLAIALLGPLQITLDGAPLASITSPKIQGLLAYLAAESDRLHSREALAELLWSGQATGRQNLRKSLSRLQAALPQPATAPAFLHSTRQGIGFNLASQHVLDLAAFGDTLAAVRRHPHQEVQSCHDCCAQLAATVDLYRGEFLDGLIVESAPFDEWTLLKREWLRREVLWILEILARHHELRGELRQSHGYTWRQLQVDPLREEAHRRVMAALAQEGSSSQALAHYAQLVERLRTELDVAPAAATTALFEQIRSDAFDPGSGRRPAVAPDRPLPALNVAPPHNLPPQFTPTIGRAALLDQIDQRSSRAECRLLTLVGPGGVGKTRLAIETARRQLHAYPDGVAFVDLSSLENGDQLPTTIAAALNLILPLHAQTPAQQRAALTRILASHRLLLVLDNYEHLLPHTDLVMALLQDTTQVDLLITSRLPLHLRAEWLLDVDGLPYPPPDTPPEQMRPDVFPALAMFRQVALQVQHGFNPTDAEWRAVARICRLVQGAPLALELAAARVRDLPVAEVAAAIEADFDFLSTTMADVPARHRSLRAVIDHSWQLLSAPQQAVFARLAVFRAGFTADAAQHVAGAEETALTEFVSQSLLQQLDRAAYTLHAALRQFGNEKLAASPSTQWETHHRHATYYLELLVSQASEICGPKALTAQATLRAAHDNLRAAWEWAATHGQLRLIDRALTAAYLYYNATGLVHEGKRALNLAQSGLESTTDAMWAFPLLPARLLAKQARFLNLQGQYEQAIDVAQRATASLAAPTDAPNLAEQATTTAEVALQWGRALLHQGQYDAAASQLGEALQAARQVRDPQLEAEVHLNQGTLCNFKNEFDAARDHFATVLRLGQSAGDRYLEGLALNNLGVAADFQGDYTSAGRYFEQALALFTAVDYRRGAANALSNLGTVAAWRGQLTQALTWHEQALQATRALGDIDGEAWSLMALGAVYIHFGRLDTARNHLHAALRLNQLDGTRTLEAWTVHHLAQAALDAGELGEAEQLAAKVKTLAEEVDDALTVAAALAVTGEIATARGQFDQAETDFAGALAINQQYDHRSGQVRVVTAQARLALARQDPQTARNLAEAALRLDDAGSVALDRAQVLAVYGRALAALGERALARTALTQALERHQQMEQHHLADALHAELAALC